MLVAIGSEKRIATVVFCALCLGAAATMGFAAPIIMAVVEELGRYIPQSDAAVGYVWALMWAVAIGFSILFWPIPAQHKQDLIIIWICRVVIALGLMPIIQYGEPGADAYAYYIWANDLGLSWMDYAIGDGTFNISRLIILHNAVLPESYHLLGVTWALVGMLGSYAFYRAARLLLNRDDRRVLYIVSLAPSILFWSSLLGKEPVSYLGMGLYAYGTVAWYKRGSAWYLLLMAFGVFLVASIRTWYAPMMVLPLVALALGRSSSGKLGNPLGRLAFLFIVAVGLMYAFNASEFASSLESTEALLQTTSSINEDYAAGGSAIDASSYSSIGGLIVSLPGGMFTALLRPLPGEVLDMFGTLAGLENLVLVGLAALGLSRFRLHYLREPIFMWVCILVLLWAAQYGLTASTNLGSLSRYRLQIQPFFLGFVLFLVAQPRIPSRRRTAGENVLPTAPIDVTMESPQQGFGRLDARAGAVAQTSKPAYGDVDAG